MKAVLFSSVAAVLALCPVVSSQNLTEYSTLSTSRAVSASHLSTDKATTKIADATGSSKGVVSPAKGAQSNSRQASRPIPPTVFIFTNGDRLESSHYVVTVDSLRLQQDGKQRTIPLSALNLNSTIAANRERGIDLKIPKNKTEIMLGF